MRNKLFFQKRLSWAERKANGRLLAQIARSQSNPIHVLALMNGEGEIINQLYIVSIFQSYYQDLYTCRAELSAYLATVNLLVLLMEDREILNAPFTLQELENAVASFPNSKAPGIDGLPIGSIKNIMKGCFQPFLIH